MSEEDLHGAMKKRDMSIGAAAGASLGALAGHAKGKAGAGAIAGGLAGSFLGNRVGTERALKDKTKQERHMADRAQAQDDRKELVKMRQKKSSFDAIMLAAMADELQHITKVAINLAPVGNLLASVGSKALGGITAAATKAAPAVAARLPGVGAAMGNAGGHMMQLGNAVGGGRQLSQMAGGALLGAGALGATGVANRVLGGGQR